MQSQLLPLCKLNLLELKPVENRHHERTCRFVGILLHGGMGGLWPAFLHKSPFKEVVTACHQALVSTATGSNNIPKFGIKSQRLFLANSM